MRLSLSLTWEIMDVSCNLKTSRYVLTPKRQEFQSMQDLPLQALAS